MEGGGQKDAEADKKMNVEHPVGRRVCNRPLLDNMPRCFILGLKTPARLQNILGLCAISF